jgi:hypothetical protein
MVLVVGKIVAAPESGAGLVSSALRNGVTETRSYRNDTNGKDNKLETIAIAHSGGTPTDRKVGDW